MKVVINEWNVKKIISFEDFSKISVAMLAPIFKKINAKHIKNKIIKDISVQKKQLDELILKQEVIVNEKTQDISHSTKEEDKQIKKERVILRFIKDMALVNSFEDFLRVIKNEFKVFHEIGEILLFQKKTDKLFKVLLSKNYFQWKEIPFSHALSEESLNDTIIHSFSGERFLRCHWPSTQQRYFQRLAGYGRGRLYQNHSRYFKNKYRRCFCLRRCAG